VNIIQWQGLKTARCRLRSSFLEEENSGVNDGPLKASGNGLSSTPFVFLSKWPREASGNQCIGRREVFVVSNRGGSGRHEQNEWKIWVWC